MNFTPVSSVRNVLIEYFVHFIVEYFENVYENFEYEEAR